MTIWLIWKEKNLDENRKPNKISKAYLNILIYVTERLLASFFCVTNMEIVQSKIIFTCCKVHKKDWQDGWYLGRFFLKAKNEKHMLTHYKTWLALIETFYLQLKKKKKSSQWKNMFPFFGRVQCMHCCGFTHAAICLINLAHSSFSDLIWLYRAAFLILTGLYCFYKSPGPRIVQI